MYVLPKRLRFSSFGPAWILGMSRVQRARLHQPKFPKRTPSPAFSREDTKKAIEEQIRSHFLTSPEEVVEEVVRARKGIWGVPNGDKRSRNDEEQAAKRQRVDRGEAELPIYATKFSDEVLAAEERRPKKKVAVLIGYSGTGYKGMQLTHDQKTIEGDLFQAFVAAGAISKANADDPKKSSFVRCARTDKGVHAAGNVISLKLIVEDDNIVKKINDYLSPQIRMWGFERTNNSFSSYQLCDSRIYEYLIPTHAFLPPHPSSYLGRKITELAKEKGDEGHLRSRQEEVDGYWKKVDEDQIKPLLETYDPETRGILEKALYLTSDALSDVAARVQEDEEGTADGSLAVGQKEASREDQTDMPVDIQKNKLDSDQPADLKRLSPVAEGIKKLRQIYILAKRAYRIPPVRLERVRNTLALYEGTRNYHNYTIAKHFRDPSAKRIIKSFVVNPEPILINGTEWLSLKVHGQSFMMHQIRKMVAMAALIVRCGCDPSRIVESYGPESISIPKAPSLGLLLERPVFDSYNKRAKSDLGKETIDFRKYEKEMNEFKQQQIYNRMYEDEERDNIFGNYFNHVDNFPIGTFLFVTSGGIPATKVQPNPDGKMADKSAMAGIAAVDSEEEDEFGNPDEGEA